MELRRLSGRRPRSLRRLSYAAQRARRRNADASFAGGEVDNWRAGAERAIRRPRCRGTPTRCTRICDTAGRRSRHGGGPMAEVVSNLSAVPDSDVRAIAIYVADIWRADPRNASARAKPCLRRRKQPMRRLAQANAAGRRSTPRPAPAATRPAGRCPIGRQSRSEHRDRAPRSAQPRQHRAVGLSPAEVTQADHAGLCRRADRRADRGAVALSAGPLLRAAGVERRCACRRGRGASANSLETRRGRQRARRSTSERAMMTLKVNGRAHRSTPIPTRRCSMCCATISSSTAPSSAAGSANAAPAP